MMGDEVRVKVSGGLVKMMLLLTSDT